MRSYNYNVYDKPIKATSESAEWIFLATNLGLEMLSAACDQASSPRRPHYALFGMLLAIAAVLISIWELIYRGKKERVVLRRWGILWWFYHSPPRRHTPFGTLPDIYGLVAGISQCICSIVQYVYCLQHADNPFKASLLPAIFLVCLGGSKLSNNRMNADTTTTDNDDSCEYSSSSAELPWLHANIPSLDDQEDEGNIVGYWQNVLEQEQLEPLQLKPLQLLQLQPLQRPWQLERLPQLELELEPLPQLELELKQLELKLKPLERKQVKLLKRKQLKQLRPKAD
ncbi:hypothetical protein ACE6H2_016089 [Prunus campanulata]